MVYNMEFYVHPWKLFLDDIRFPPRNAEGEIDGNWRIARTVDEAISMCKVKGLPWFISFDHDLGDEENGTGMEFAKWLVEYHISNDIKPTFDYAIHSMNPIGAKNIDSYLQSFIKHWHKENS